MCGFLLFFVTVLDLLFPDLADATAHSLDLAGSYVMLFTFIGKVKRKQKSPWPGGIGVG